MKKLILLGSLLVTQLTFSQTKFSKGDQFASVSYGLGTQAFVGSRYFFNDNIAAFAELGYGLAYLNIGGTYKF